MSNFNSSFQSTVAAASTSSNDVDDVISDGEDVLLPIDDVDVWIDPLDATQVCSMFLFVRQ